VSETNKHTFFFGRVVTATASVTADDDKARLIRCRVPFELWAIFIAWLENLRWTVAAGDDAADKPGRSRSWVELALAFRLQTNFSFGDLDLASAADIVSVAVRRLLTLMPPAGDRLRNMASCHSTMSAVGFYLPGIDRRPILPSGTWQNILQQLRAALLARPDSAAVCRGNFGRFGALLACRDLRTDVKRDGLSHVEAALAGRVILQPATAARQPQPRSCKARVGPCALGCVSSAGRANGLQTWHGLPAAWGVATGLLGDDFFADDAVLGGIDADAVPCARHYRHACRASDRAVLQPDAPT